MLIGKCSTCAKWVAPKEGNIGWNIGVGRCTNVPMYFDATEETETADRLLKPEFVGIKAFALDGSGYIAKLLTSPDFGCVDFEQRV